MTVEGLSDIERSLALRQWIPSAPEVALGEGFFRCAVALRGDPVPADMPPPRAGRGPWMTQRLAADARLAREAEEHLLPAWRGQLAGSPMLTLVETFVAAGRELAPHVESLLAAWRTSPPPSPSSELVEREAARLRVSRHDAKATIRRFDVERWEAELLPPQRLQQLDAAAGNVMHRATVIITAAATGDIAP
ncbi:hypothetical protein [Streptomyces noursei]|uniref:hypothetical protein n=1 Tax=Streptomyces noursei TaxID=1971 RepID=UPI001671B94B|nr:hypothetical protein [Streptomyces noursei]MCZ1013924.1 hypothetical protein [Streptomyces noursei]